MGLFGSKHFINKQKEEKKDKVYPSIAAYFNLDMVGRLEGKPLTVHGTGSSALAWSELVDSVSGDLELKKSDNPYLLPTLLLFIMLEFQYWHCLLDYMTITTHPGTIDKIDYTGLEKVSKYLRDLTTATANLESAPTTLRSKGELDQLL